MECSSFEDNLSENDRRRREDIMHDNFEVRLRLQQSLKFHVDTRVLG